MDLPRKEMMRTLWRPSRSYEHDAVKSEKILILGFALIGSAIAFGVVHLDPGLGWQVGKLPEAIYGGLVLGFLYIKYGFHIAVLTHWGLDYVGTVFAYFGKGAYGIPIDSSPGFALQQAVNLDLLGGIGLFSFLLVVYLGLERLRPSLVGEPRPPS
jgi:membrane protease YdiL (CAAX protease family)